MIRSKALLLCLTLAMLNIAALAQEKRFEVSGSLGYTAANFLNGDSKFRPYAIAGLGVTEYAPGTLTATPGGSATPVSINLDNKAKFGMTYGGGIKYFLTPLFGFKMQARWTPTFIGSQSDGIWCNALYCGTISSSKWSNQGEFSGGLILRF
jgi:Outer membrane protein beta-barrel domain